MKNKRSNTPAFLVVVSVACLLLGAACSQDDTPFPMDGMQNGNAIRFTSTIARYSDGTAPDTRAIIDETDGTGSFTNGDETILMGSDYTAVPRVTKERSAIYKDRTWVTDMTWDEFSRDAKIIFSAFFPKRSVADFTEGVCEVILPTDQSTPAQYAAYDWLHAETIATKSDQPIELTFRHLMHRLTVNLSLSATPGTLTQADVDAATIVIKNMCTKGDVSVNGYLDSFVNSPTGDFTPLRSASGNSFHTLLLPQQLTSGTPWIEITVGGKTVIYSVPVGLVRLEGGKEQVVNLELTVSPASSGYAIGDYWPDSSSPEGIVFWLKPGSLGSQGKVVALDETYVSRWGVDNDEQNAGVTGIRSVTNGATATGSMIAKYKSSGTFDADYPAFYYIHNTVNGSDENGVWYLPARDELKMLYAGYSGKVYESIVDWEAGIMPDKDSPECTAARSAFNAKLTAKGGKAIGSSDNSVNWWYLSSSEIANRTSYSFSFEKGGYSYDPKSFDGNIRWIRDF